MLLSNRVCLGLLNSESLKYRNSTVTLKKSSIVHLKYGSAWVSRDSTVNKDIKSSSVSYKQRIERTPNTF